jgi:hypothetical protein
MTKQRYIITLQVEPSPYPPEIRLRRFLKQALRQFDLKCISIEAVGPSTETTAATGDVTPIGVKLPAIEGVRLC